MQGIRKKYPCNMGDICREYGRNAQGTRQIYVENMIEVPLSFSVCITSSLDISSMLPLYFVTFVILPYSLYISSVFPYSLLISVVFPTYFKFCGYKLSRFRKFFSCSRKFIPAKSALSDHSRKIS